MIQILLVGLGAGAAAGLLFAAVATGSISATILFYLAPLPILIAALGWSHWTGLIAAFVAAAGLAALLGTYFLVAFLIGVGLPAWWLGYLALLGRPVGAVAGAPPALEWYPAGRLVLWAALLATLMVTLAIPSFGTDQASFQAGLRSAFERALHTEPGAEIPGGADLDRVIDILVAAIPPAAAMLATLTGLLNLWLAGRIVRMSGRLKRPWPDLPTLTLPRLAPALLAAAIVGTFIPGLFGIVADALAAAVLTAYVLLGLAVLHAITRGMGVRSFLLGGTYAVVLLFGWPVLMLSMLGLAENAFHIRDRVAARGGPPHVKT